MLIRGIFAGLGALAGLAFTTPGEAADGWTTRAVNMRTCAGTRCPRILTIPEGARVWVYYCDLWCHVFYAGHRGFAFGRYIALEYYREPPVVIVPPPVYREPPVYHPPPRYRPPPPRKRPPPRRLPPPGYEGPIPPEPPGFSPAPPAIGGPPPEPFPPDKSWPPGESEPPGSYYRRR
ncbi:MAG: hypothetical protein R3D45_07670 [Rhizobiaceae bacterium]